MPKRAPPSPQEALFRRAFGAARSARPDRNAVGLAVLVGIGLVLAAGTPLGVDLVLLALGALVAVVAPAAAVGAVLVAVPLAFRPVAIGGGAFALSEVAIGLVAVGIGRRMVGGLGSPSGGGGMRRLAAPLSVTLPAVALLMVATSTLATLTDAGYRRESLREFRLVIVEPLVFFVAARAIVRDAAGRRLVVRAFVGTGVAVAALAIGQVVVGAGGVAADGAYRARGPYRHPNNLALYLERVGVFAAGLVAASWPARSARVALAAAVVLLAGGVATWSRGLLLAVAAGLAVVVALVGSRRGWLIYGVGLAIALVGFGVAAGGRLLDAGGTGSVPTRLLVWRASLRMALDHPLFGVGLDQFYPLYGRRYVEPAGWPERFTSHPHNLLLDLWLRVGILGAVAFAWLLTAVGWLIAGWRSRRTGGDRAVGIGAVAALVAGLAHGLVDNGFFLPDLAIMTWFSIALIEAAAGVEERTGPVGGR